MSRPRAARPRVDPGERFGALVGTTPAMRAVFHKLRILAPTTICVLIEGETGTGKELVARALHDHSTRAGKPFVVLDCAAIPAKLADRMLCGLEKRNQPEGVGYSSPFVAAHGGTLILDSLGELPPEVRPKLLRILEEQRVRSVGGRRDVPVDVRIVAATGRARGEKATRGEQDSLYFRVAQERITMPPLRERTRDIDLLIRHLMDLAGRGPDWKRVTPASLRELHRHDWPGNVRELRNLVAVALAHDEGGPIDLTVPLRESLVGRPARGRRYAVKARASDSYGESKARHDRAFFTALFEATGGNLSQMGRRAQLSRETVRAYLKALGIGGYGK
jgi:DNA-binding NtrC family response regulator